MTPMILQLFLKADDTIPPAKHRRPSEPIMAKKAAQQRSVSPIRSAPDIAMPKPVRSATDVEPSIPKPPADSKSKDPKPKAGPAMGFMSFINDGFSGLSRGASEMDIAVMQRRANGTVGFMEKTKSDDRAERAGEPLSKEKKGMKKEVASGRNSSSSEDTEKAKASGAMGFMAYVGLASIGKSSSKSNIKPRDSLDAISRAAMPRKESSTVLSLLKKNESDPPFMKAMKKLCKGLHSHPWHTELAGLLPPPRPGMQFLDVLFSPVGNCVLYTGMEAHGVSAGAVLELLDLDFVLMVWEEVSGKWAKKFPLVLEVAARSIMKNWLELMTSQLSDVAWTYVEVVSGMEVGTTHSPGLFHRLHNKTLHRLNAVVPAMLDFEAQRRIATVYQGKKRATTLVDLVKDRPAVLEHVNLLMDPLGQIQVQIALCLSGQLQTSQLAEHVNVDARDREGKSFLHHVARTSHVEVAEKIIAMGIDVNAVNKDGKTALDESCIAGRKHMAALLLDLGAVPKSLVHAEAGQNWDIVALLLARGADASHISKRAQAAVAKLTTVDLAGCRLKSLHPNLAEVRGMACLDVRNNAIATLDCDWLSALPSLTVILVSGNPLMRVHPSLASRCSKTKLGQTVDSSKKMTCSMSGSLTLSSVGHVRSFTMNRRRSLEGPTRTRPTKPLVFSPAAADVCELNIDRSVVSYLELWISTVVLYDDSVAAEQIEVFVHMHTYLVPTTVLVTFLLRFLAELGQSASELDDNHVVDKELPDVLCELLQRLYVWCFQREPEQKLLLALIASHVSSIAALWESSDRSPPSSLALLRLMTSQTKLKAPPPFLGSLTDPRAFSCPPVRLSAAHALDNSVLECIPAKPLALLQKRHVPVDVLAECITQYQYRLFQNIPINEFLYMNCTRRTRSPNYHRLIHSHNALSQWVIASILAAKSLPHTVHTLWRAVETAHAMMNAGNLLGMCSIMSGLQSFSVFRLKKIWGFLPGNAKGMMEDMQAVLAFGRNFHKYRAMRPSFGSPSLPLMLIEVRDLMYFEEMDTVKPELNFNKINGIFSVLRFIQTSRVNPIGPDRFPVLQRFVNAIFEDTSYYMEEDVQNTLSKAMQPDEKGSLAVSLLNDEIHIYKSMCKLRAMHATIHAHRMRWMETGVLGVSDISQDVMQVSAALKKAAQNIYEQIHINNADLVTKIEGDQSSLYTIKK